MWDHLYLVLSPLGEEETQYKGHVTVVMGLTVQDLSYHWKHKSAVSH